MTQRRGFAARRPVEWLEIPLGLPSKDAKSEAFRVELFPPWTSQRKGALIAIRREIQIDLQLTLPHVDAIVDTFRVKIATFRAGGDEISTHAKFAKVWVGFPRFRATRIGTKLQ